MGRKVRRSRMPSKTILVGSIFFGGCAGASSRCRRDAASAAGVAGAGGVGGGWCWAGYRARRGWSGCGRARGTGLRGSAGRGGRDRRGRAAASARWAVSKRMYLPSGDQAMREAFWPLARKVMGWAGALPSAGTAERLVKPSTPVSTKTSQLESGDQASSAPPLLSISPVAMTLSASGGGEDVEFLAVADDRRWTCRRATRPGRRRGRGRG